MRPNELSSTDGLNSAAKLPLKRAFINGDKAPLQQVFASVPSSDTSSPPSSPPSLATPQRRSFNSPKLGFQTPSPPKGLPELPDFPLHSEDEGSGEDDAMPARLSVGANDDFSSMKTPKPPGAWASSPAPLHISPLVRSHSLPDSDGFGREAVSESCLPTPVASLSRASSLPPQTPAPPGAWMATPGLERKRSMLKVRFDVESEQSAPETPVNGQDGQPKGSHQNILQGLCTTAPQAQDSQFSGQVETKNETVDTPVTPRTTPPSTLGRSPSIRIVNAFGRDAVEPPVTLPPMTIPNTPRSKSLVRIVDAMGREVEEVTEADSEVKSEEDMPLDHNEAVKRVRQSIADLASGLREVDRYCARLFTNSKGTDPVFFNVP